MNGFWIRLWWPYYSPLLQKNLRFIFIYLLSLSTFHWFSNKQWSKYQRTQKFKTVQNFIICTLQHIYNMLQYEIYSPLSSNKTAQWNSQHCTKLHNKVHNNVGHNALHNKVYLKIDLSLCLYFVKQVKNKAYILSWVFKLLPWKHLFVQSQQKKH